MKIIANRVQVSARSHYFLLAITSLKLLIRWKFRFFALYTLALPQWWEAWRFFWCLTILTSLILYLRYRIWILMFMLKKRLLGMPIIHVWRRPRERGKLNKALSHSTSPEPTCRYYLSIHDMMRGRWITPINRFCTSLWGFAVSSTWSLAGRKPGVVRSRNHLIALWVSDEAANTFLWSGNSYRFRVPMQTLPVARHLTVLSRHRLMMASQASQDTTMRFCEAFPETSPV